jgi:hypothetical protein
LGVVEDELPEAIPDELLTLPLGGFIGVTLGSALASYLLPIPFVLPAVVLGAVWLWFAGPRLLRAFQGRVRFRERVPLDGPSREVRTGFRPIRVRWVLTWGLVAVVAVPLALALLFL